MYIKWSIFILYCIGMLYIGWLGYKRTKSTSDYFVAGRTLGIWVAVPLFAAGFFSAASVVGQSAVAYKEGWSYFVIYPVGLSLGWVLLAIIAPKFSRVKKPWITTADMFADRYYSPKVIRGLLAVFLLLNMSLLVIQGLTGAGAILSAYLNISYELAVILMGIVFVVYTAFGGMFSVSWTNVVQFLLLFFAVGFSALFGIAKSGGLSNLSGLLYEFDPNLLTATFGGKYSISYIVGTILTLALGCPILIYYHRMFFSCRSDRVAVGMIGYGAVGLALCYLGILFIGLTARAILPTALVDAEGVFTALVNTMNPVVGAVVISGVIAALQSSVDNQLLSASSVASSDLYKKIINPEGSDEKVMKVSMWTTLIIGTICVVVAYFRPATIIQLYIFNTSLGVGVIFAPMVLGLYWSRTTKEAGIFGVIFGFFGTILWIAFGIKTIPPALIILPANIIIMVIISLNTAKPPQSVTDTFFNNFNKERLKA